MASVTVFVLMFMPRQACFTGFCASGALGFVGVISLDRVLVLERRGPSRVRRGSCRRGGRGGDAGDTAGGT